MNTEKFLSVYSESRNGCNHWVRHPLVRNFLFTDGVQELAETGCHWLIDILATEYKVPQYLMGIVHITVTGSRAVITGSLSDEEPPQFRKDITWTDMPDGEWMLYVSAAEGDGIMRCLLPTEY